MNTLAIFLALACVLTCRHVNAHECDEDIKELIGEIENMINNETSPKCVTDLYLKQFRCCEENEEENHKCITEVTEIAMKKTEMPEECKEYIQKHQAKMMGEEE
ncbi:hypothetical protein CDAR_589721 [Caerostris darwini]|uniref:Uncharacterized protein n=1 Tax=Caerostris darwini TaxID=1538125 RepID=A0AAV4PHS9_9ARAC|nr:hypothetical protein CDAR_589721 [Caerostris darwini]